MILTIITVVTVLTITMALGAFSLYKVNRGFRELVNQIIYEVIYYVVGLEGIVDDLLCKSINKVELENNSSKTVLITGGCRGIGVEVIKMFLKCDMHVIVGCRNVNAAKQLLEVARKEGISTGHLKPFELDVASLESVRKFSKEVKKHYTKIHILLNNAGIMYVPFAETVDGYESQFATNYLGHHLLTHQLLPLLQAAGESGANARIVNVNTIAHEQGNINFDDINYKKDQYIPLKAYAQSKLAQMLSMVHIHEKLKEAGHFVQINAVHPGIVDTDLFNGTIVKKYTPWALKLLFKNALAGAQPIVYACISPNLEGKGGAYISNCRIHPVGKVVKSPELQEKMFKFTNKLLNIENFGSPN